MACIERGFYRRQRKTAAICNLEGHRLRLLAKLLVRHDLVDESEFQGPDGTHFWISEPDVLRSFLADHIFQAPRPVPCVEASHHRAPLAKDGGMLGNPYLAHHLQGIAATHGKAIPRRYHRLLQTVDAF